MLGIEKSKGNALYEGSVSKNVSQGHTLAFFSLKFKVKNK